MNASIRRLALGTVLLASAAAAQDRSDEVPGLLVTLKSEDGATRAGAAQALGQIGAAAHDAVADLTAALKDAQRDVRRNAAQALGEVDALGRLGTRDVEAALKEARKDKQEAVENAARASLERIKKLPKAVKKK